MNRKQRLTKPSKTLNETLVETSEPGSPYSNISKEDIELAFKWFPHSPLAFNALTFLAAAAQGIDSLDNLKTACIYLDLEVKARGGWDNTK